MTNGSTNLKTDGATLLSATGGTKVRSATNTCCCASNCNTCNVNTTSGSVTISNFYAYNVSRWWYTSTGEAYPFCTEGCFFDAPSIGGTILTRNTRWTPFFRITNLTLPFVNFTGGGTSLTANFMAVSNIQASSATTYSVDDINCSDSESRRCTALSSVSLQVVMQYNCFFGRWELFIRDASGISTYNPLCGPGGLFQGASAIIVPACSNAPVTATIDSGCIHENNLNNVTCIGVSCGATGILTAARRNFMTIDFTPNSLFI